MRKESVVLATIVAITILLIGGAAFFLSSSQEQTPTDTKVDDTALLLGDATHSIGSSSAKVTIVEFADFQCPACGAAFPVVKQIVEEYKDDVSYVFRHFPLPGHKNARAGAQAAEAAGKQGRFFEMHDLLFINQSEWSEGNDAEQIFEGYAESLALDMEQFRTDRDAAATNTAIQDDQDDALQLGVNSTPTFYIDGEKNSGVISYDRFKELLDAKLQ